MRELNCGFCARKGPGAIRAAAKSKGMKEFLPIFKPGFIAYSVQMQLLPVPRLQ
jgi:hypothetical protein